jgi:hypothetical protein
MAMSQHILKSSLSRWTLAAALAIGSVTSTLATLLDDFNGAQRTGWTDANPAGLPLPGGQQGNGVLTFKLPGSGQSYFVSSTKTSPTLELKEGRTVELRADLVSGQGPDSFAVLAFIPLTTGANSLAGYGIAKSETDILVTKGISKYFADESPATPIKNSNVTMVLNLRVLNGEVHIWAQILDKDANNQVLWEKRFVDTAAADEMRRGSDSPAAPFVTTGNFVLYLYGDTGTDPAGYQVVFDNAQYFITETTTLDDFNAAQRSGWEDSNPAGLPVPGGKQANGLFTFDLPAIGQPFFVASVKTTKTITLEEGTQHEFAVDMLSGRGGDSFAVIGFIPKSPGPNSLAGYGLAKSETDVLVTKGISKYFIDDDTTPVKNENVRLVLTLTVQSGTVYIRGRVLDKDNNNQVIWDKTFADTPQADVLGTGTDNPPAPYIGASGNVVLYLYADGGQDPAGYQVVYDNLTVSEPPAAANQQPIISSVSPKDGAAFLNAPVTLSFAASDDKDLPDAGISVSINGTLFTSTNGLVLSGPATNRTVTLSSGTVANANYLAQLVVTDSESVSVTNLVYFDTFTASNRIIELEDYNFGSGQYFDQPVPGPEGAFVADSYAGQVGVEGVDFHETRTSPRAQDTLYRPEDPVRMQHSLDQARAKYNPDAGVYGYDLIDIDANEWLNYTRDFAPGNYAVYLRVAIIGFPQADSVLELVTSNPGQPEQTVSLLGSFLGKTSGFTFRNVPLTDGSGLNKVPVRLSGRTTLRVRQITADTSSSTHYQNYLVFVPLQDAGVQRALITSVQPSPDSTVETVTPSVTVVLQNRDTTVDTNSIVLEVNEQKVAPAIQATAAGATVTWPMASLPASGAVNSAKISFSDNQGTNQSTSWKFTVTYPSVDPANARPTPGPERGMQVRVVQAAEGSNLDNSLDRAEQQLAGSIAAAMSTNVVMQFISMNKAGTPVGDFTEVTEVPGIDGSNGMDDFVVEAQTWLELPAGVYEFGVRTDDGYKLSAGSTTASKQPVLAFHNGGPADERVGFVVPVSGVYPFRFVWYERGGAGLGQWYSIDRATGERILINDPSSPKAIRAWLSAALPALRVQSSATVASGYIDDTAVTIDAGAKRITIPLSGPMRFYRLVGATNIKIASAKLQGATLVLAYE